MIIATHSGKFHADDVWAVTVLDIVFPGCALVRTRDPERIRAADFAVDVGGIWDPQAGRFDHHQKDFSGARLSGVGYASAGLVWRTHGPRCVTLLAQKHVGHTLAPEEAQQIAWAIDNDLVQYLDMSDTGTARNAPGGYGLSAVVSGFNPTWLDEQEAGGVEAADALRLKQFRRAMEVVADVLVNQVRYRVGSMLALERVRKAPVLEDGRLLVLDNGALPWTGVVRNEMPKVLFVIGYGIADGRYSLNTVPANPDTFEARADLPKEWAGLQGEELAAVTGVADAVFCHNNLFIAVALSYEGALALARQALAAVQR
ncbi:MYG1 family protein [Noviherbaspirillum denitrificans]|uniref:Metal-dependent hydrolase n=1 Tax=Noviherbaspirillum denitrificans TaxID=1968433 RepID=A0A254THX8_9BURK|nr:MYG1 family protein [Noviherbaspirillum denitrificans]OWW22115.1 metal-dependent hydrolase [Noviherbaspirillum denitrificans]